MISEDKRKRDESDQIDEDQKRAKVHAQRKFAQGSTPSIIGLNASKEKERCTQSENCNSSNGQFVNSFKKPPKTEDFLTFLCFRGTPLIPRKWEIFNFPQQLDIELEESYNSQEVEVDKTDIITKTNSNKVLKENKPTSNSIMKSQSVRKKIICVGKNGVKDRLPSSEQSKRKSSSEPVSTSKRLKTLPNRCSSRFSPRKSNIRVSASTLIAKKKSKAARLRSHNSMPKFARMLKRLGIPFKKVGAGSKGAYYNKQANVRVTRSTSSTLDHSISPTFSKKVRKSILQSSDQVKRIKNKDKAGKSDNEKPKVPKKLSSDISSPPKNSMITRKGVWDRIKRNNSKGDSSKTKNNDMKPIKSNQITKKVNNTKSEETNIANGTMRVLRNRSVSCDEIQLIVDQDNKSSHKHSVLSKKDKNKNESNKNFDIIKEPNKCEKKANGNVDTRPNHKDTRRNSQEFLKIANKKLPPDKLRKIRSMDNLVNSDQFSKNGNEKRSMASSKSEAVVISASKLPDLAGISKPLGVVAKLRRGSLDSAKEANLSRIPAARPSRKTKTVASLYLEILSKKLNSSDEEIDDPLTLSSLPNLRSMAVQNSCQSIDSDLKEFLEDYKACSEESTRDNISDGFDKMDFKEKKKEATKEKEMGETQNTHANVCESSRIDGPKQNSVKQSNSLNSVPCKEISSAFSSLHSITLNSPKSRPDLCSAFSQWPDTESPKSSPLLSLSYSDKLTKVLKLVSSGDPNRPQNNTTSKLKTTASPTVHGLEPEITTIHIERPSSIDMDSAGFKNMRKPIPSCSKLASYHSDLSQTVLSGEDPMLGVIPVDTETLVVKVPPEEVLATLHNSERGDCSQMFRSVPASKITVLDTVTATATSMVVSRGQDISHMFDKKCSQVLNTLNMADSNSLGNMAKIEVIKKLEGISVIKSKEPLGFIKSSDQFLKTKNRSVDCHLKTALISSTKKVPDSLPSVDTIIKDCKGSLPIKNSTSIAVQVDVAELSATSDTQANLSSKDDSITPEDRKTKLSKEAGDPKSRKTLNNQTKSLNPKAKHEGDLNKRTAMNKEGKIVQGPVFKPSAEEFQDPIQYIEKIWGEAEPFGICKVVPPNSFKPECNVNDEMRFTAHNHYIHKMFHRWGSVTKETAAIKKVLQTQGIDLPHTPWVGSLEIDLTKLYHTVETLGGLKSVIEKSKWNKVADLMKISKSVQDRASKLDDIYCKFLLPYAALTNDERKALHEEVEVEFQQKLKINEVEDCVVKGRTVPLSQYYRMARNTHSMWFRNPDPSPEEVESLYWKIVTSRDQHVCVHAGNIDSGFGGYGFPCNKQRPISKHPWNLKVLSSNARSILRCIGPVMGVTIPTIHVGMLFSSCCWYRDPHCLPWIEYLHTGAPKIWYSVPDSQSAHFHQAMTSLVPDYCHPGQIWLASDTTMVPPNALVKESVVLTRIVQNPGEFIIVFPKSFTSAICTGYLVAESVYFALHDCLPLAKEAFQAMNDSQEPSMFPWEKLVFSIAKETKVSRITLEQVLPMINEILSRERNLQQQLVKLGIPSEQLQAEKSGKRKSVMNEEEECDECRQSLYVSMLHTSIDNSNYCLTHGLALVTKKPKLVKNCKLLYSYTMEDIEGLRDRIQQRLAALSVRKDNKKKLLKK